LNPDDPQNLGPLGTLMAASCFWEEGVSIAEKGIALTAPSTPRWRWWAIAKRHWFHSEYPSALEAFRQAFVDEVWLSPLQMAYRLPFLGRRDEAKAHVASLLRLSPGFTVRRADAYYIVCGASRRPIVRRCGMLCEWPGSLNESLPRLRVGLL